MCFHHQTTHPDPSRKKRGDVVPSMLQRVQDPAGLEQIGKRDPLHEVPMGWIHPKKDVLILGRFSWIIFHKVRMIMKSGTIFFFWGAKYQEGDGKRECCD